MIISQKIRPRKKTSKRKKGDGGESRRKFSRFHNEPIRYRHHGFAPHCFCNKLLQKKLWRWPAVRPPSSSGSSDVTLSVSYSSALGMVTALWGVQGNVAKGSSLLRDEGWIKEWGFCATPRRGGEFWGDPFGSGGGRSSDVSELCCCCWWSFWVRLPAN